MNTVLREEKKYLFRAEDAKSLEGKLDSVLTEDENNGAEGYIIRSLYFDTIYDSDFFDKVDGIETRRKLRLRIYDPKGDFAMLEMKQKQGSRQLKRSLRMTRADAEELIRGNSSVLLSYPDEFAAECYALILMKCYRPRTIVQYRRKAYVAKENRIRVNFDTKIEATESSFDLFAEDLNMYPVFDQYRVILEVKYNGFLLSYIKDLLKKAEKSEISVSKYTLARQQAYGTGI